MSKYDDYLEDTAKVGKNPGELNSDDIAFLASRSDDPLKTAADYEMFNETDRAQSSGNGGGSQGGCYIATCVYGSYDCPQVRVLRRFRDGVLKKTLPGRAFIRVYYAVSPGLVARRGHSGCFRRFWRRLLDRFVCRLQKRGLSDAPYSDL